ncbi:MAG: hypothetical protein ACLPKT_20400, partial [Methylocella sp.]
GGGDGLAIAFLRVRDPDRIAETQGSVSSARTNRARPAAPPDTPYPDIEDAAIRPPIRRMDCVD